MNQLSSMLNITYIRMLFRSKLLDKTSNLMWNSVPNLKPHLTTYNGSLYMSSRKSLNNKIVIYVVDNGSGAEMYCDPPPFKTAVLLWYFGIAFIMFSCLIQHSNEPLQSITYDSKYITTTLSIYVLLLLVYTLATQWIYNPLVMQECRINTTLLLG